MKIIEYLLAIFVFILWILLFVNLAHAFDVDVVSGEIKYDAPVAQKMLMEIQQCRIDNQVMQMQDERLKIQEQIIQGKDELLKVKDDIIKAKDVQITTLKATETIKQLEDIISVQGNALDRLQPNTVTRIIGMVIFVLTFGSVSIF